MKSILKWFFIIGGLLVIIVIAAIVIIPQVVDIQKYKPVIEEKVTENTGRSFSMGDNIDLSIFPWVGVSVTDVRFGNPAGFSEKQMVTVDKFEVRLKVMPLLSRRIEIKTFVLNQPRIFLEKLKNGRSNWENIGNQNKGAKTAKPKTQQKSEPMGDQGLPVKDLKVGNFAITKGRVTYIDQTTGLKKEIRDLNLTLAHISLDNPVDITFSARLDDKPISLKGTAGPLGMKPGKGTLNLNFALNLLEQLDVKIEGTVTDPAESPKFDMGIDVAPFSVKKLAGSLGIALPVKPKDPTVLEKISLNVRAAGTPKAVTLSNGKFKLDDSSLKFSASAKEFSKPNLAFDLDLDKIDLDRYLPEQKKSDQQKKEGKPAESKAATNKKTDYGPLRKLVLDGKIKIGALKAANASVQDVVVHILAKNGVITVDPMDLKLYNGNFDSKAVLNVQGNTPKMALNLAADKIQAGPLIKDVAKKEIIEGTMQSNLDISFSGDTPDLVKQSLTGKGQMLFADGAIIGIDLADSVRNVQSKLGLAEKPTEKPRTDFAELKMPFTSKNGLVNINGTSLTSPLLRVLVSGNVTLPKDLLDLRVEPKFVATLKGQGDTKERKGLLVPVLITGTFASPKIRPDLKGMIGGGALDTENLKKQILGDEKQQKATIEEQKKGIETQKQNIEKQIKSLIPGFTN